LKKIARFAPCSLLTTLPPPRPPHPAPPAPHCSLSRYQPKCHGIGDSGPTPFDPTKKTPMSDYTLSDPSQWLCAGNAAAQQADHRCKTDGSVVIQAAGACPAMCGAHADFKVSGSTGQTATTAGTPVKGSVDCLSTNSTIAALCISQTAACSDFAGSSAPWKLAAAPDAPYAVPSFLNEVSAGARSQPACALTQPAG